MQTDLHPLFKGTAIGEEAEAILRSCVHCGFCNATCPTYQELGDERDGPRGRIYLVKQLFETGSASDKTRLHLDRCLNCRSCETTCPSGVQYGRLADLGKAVIEQQQTRPLSERLVRWGLRQVLPYRRRFNALLKVGQFMRPVLPQSVARKIPATVKKLAWPAASHPRKMLYLESCGQQGATPNTNIAAAKVLDRLGITLTAAPRAGCCGALSYHLSETDEGLDYMRRNIDAWWPAIEAGAEAIVVTASGCGVTVKEYGELLRSDPHYAPRAQRVSALAKDLVEVISLEDIERLAPRADTVKTAVHCPCTLQHGLGLPDNVERLLIRAGLDLAATTDKHLCCGSAGSYSITQPELSASLLDKKLKALSIDNPERIVTANVGCQMHLATAATVPVMHWIEVVEQNMT